MNVPDFLNSPVARALGWTLLHAGWQGFALVLPTAVALSLLRRRASAVRYAVGVLALFAQLTVSVITFARYYQPAVTTLATVRTVTDMQASGVRWPVVTHQLPWHQQTGQFLESHLSQFVLIYLIGVAVFGLRLIGGWAYLLRVSRTATQPTGSTWGALTDRLRAALAVRTVVRVRESARIAVPMVVGVLKPVLLLPVGLVTLLSPREIEAVLAHELAHIKRHDYAVNLLQSVMEVVFFFHPALWWLSARVREEREHCCDDLAVRVCGGDGRVLAQALARVEELRLAQAGQPALAMAFASNRPQLLHRVRRMLGVPTRPVVSNGSLVGLTLATLLLVSVSVYAVQQQDKQPKPKSKPHTTQSKATRRHKVDGNSEYGMMGDKKVSYIIWKGQKLPATHVTRLQRQLHQVMAGQLSLDAVKQPDRDILLTIIEKNNAFDSGMDGLAAGLSQLDYNTIIKTGMDAANAAGTFPVNVDSVLKEVEKLDYNGLIRSAMATVDTNIFFNDNGITRSGNADVVNRYHQRQMDSLSQLIAQRSQQIQAVRLKMETMRFPVEELKRSQDVLIWRRDKLMEQRNALVEKHQRLLQNEGKPKLSQIEIEKQLEALQPEIKKLEGKMEDLNKQFETINAQEEQVQQPFNMLKQETQELENQIGRLADQISSHSDGLIQLMPKIPNVPEIDIEGRVVPTYPHPALRPPKAPKAPVRPNGKVRVTPAVPVQPNVRVEPAPRPAPKPKAVPTPAPKPRD